MAKNGFRDKPAATKKQLENRLEQVETLLANLQTALKVQQMVVQQFAQNFGGVNRDISQAMGVLNDLQYRTLALVETAAVSKDELDVIADKLKLKDYNEASDRDDTEKGYTVQDVVESDSVVTITSECENEDQSIFRSKFKLNETMNQDLMDQLPGKKVGDKVDITLNGVKHTMEVLAIRKAPEEVAPEEDAGSQPQADAVQ